MVAALRNFQQAHGKPMVFTEVGYRSGDGANRAPWDWEAKLAYDPAEQADCYEAMFAVWSGETSWMKGVFWWSWAVSQPKAGDTGYEPWTLPLRAVGAHLVEPIAGGCAGSRTRLAWPSARFRHSPRCWPGRA